MKSKMVCSKCGNDSFKIEWRYKNEGEAIRLSLCHDGWGFQIEDSYIACSKCNRFMEYGSKNFINIKETGK